MFEFIKDRIETLTNYIGNIRYFDKPLFPDFYVTYKAVGKTYNVYYGKDYKYKIVLTESVVNRIYDPIYHDSKFQTMLIGIIEEQYVANERTYIDEHDIWFNHI